MQVSRRRLLTWAQQQHNPAKLGCHRFWTFGWHFASSMETCVFLLLFWLTLESMAIASVHLVEFFPSIKLLNGHGCSKTRYYLSVALLLLDWMGFSPYHYVKGLYLHSLRTWWFLPPACLFPPCRPPPHMQSEASWCHSPRESVWTSPTAGRPSAPSARTPPASPCQSHRPTKKR